MRAWLVNLAIGAASLAVGLACVEGVVRGAGLGPGVDALRPGDPASPFVLSPDPILGYEMKPGYRNEKAGLAINKDGLRDHDRPHRKPAGVRRIAMVGDSVVFGLYIADFAQTLPARLEERLGGDVEVFNFGVRGYCTQAEIRLFEDRGLDYDFDLVLVVFLRNDHRNFNAILQNPMDYPRPAWTQALFGLSQAFRLAAFRFDLWGFRQQLDPDWGESQRRQAFDDDNVAAGLARLAELQDRHGFGVALLVWPMFARDNPVDPAGLFEDDTQTRMKVEAIAARHGFPVVRLSEPLQNDYRRRRAAGETRNALDLYTFDGMHPNPFGTRVTADIVAELLTERREWWPE